MSFKSNVSLPRTSIVLLVVLLAVCVNGYPWNQGGQDENGAAVETALVLEQEAEPSLVPEARGAPEEHQRFKRATCDLTSGTSAGSSICAAHCLVKGFRGGYCNDKLVCVCRN
uniref:Invertebrate defensins family profile domain-containing protein n=1 Tax=Anopheles atroparvus TaxID=41427 RepID=A0A182IZF8_ANOAO